MKKVLRRLGYLVLKRRRDAELAAELEFHRTERERQLERTGMSAADARAAACRAMGNVTLAREDVRHVWLRPTLEGIAQDIRFGARALMKAPAFTLTAALTLALGIGGSTVMFSIVDAVLLRPLPYADSSRLAMIWSVDRARDLHEGATSIPTVKDWRSRSQSFADMAFWRIHTGNVSGASESERVNGLMASANLIPLLGVRPALGRTFSAEEETERAAVVVLSHRLWLRRFGADRSIVGRSIVVDGHTLQVIGVMPESFQFPTRDIQHWVPATLAIPWAAKPRLAERWWDDRFADFWHVTGRLDAGASFAAAQAEMTTIGRSLAQAFPKRDPDFIGFGVEVVPMLEQVIGRKLRLALWILLAAVGCVLLIACANVANLLLARGATRSREFAVRAALGAGRPRLIRQALIENLMLAAGAGVVGSAGAVAGIPLIVAAAPAIPRLDEVAVDATVLAFSAAASIATGLLFGVWPALTAAHERSADALKEHAPSAPGGRSVRRARSVLVILECTLAVALLAGAGLLIRSALEIGAIDPGFEPRNVLVVRVNLPLPASRDWRRQEWEAFQEINDRLGRLPGVVRAAAVTNLLTVRNPEEAITVEGRSATNDTSGVLVHTEDILPGFFDVMRVRLRGRDFTHHEQNAKVAIVNEAFADRFFGTEEPIGKRFREGTGKDGSNWITVIGVAANMHRQGLEREPAPEFFFASSEPIMDIVIRTESNPAAIIPAARETIRSVVPSAVVIRTATVDGLMGESGLQRRLQTWLLASFALVSLLLAVVGVYGVMHFAVTERAHEFALRIALGATRGDLSLLVLTEGMRLPLAGLTFGLIITLGLTRVLEHLLFGITATDPATYAAVALVLLAAALVACWLPARRAAAADPIAALRSV